MGENESSTIKIGYTSRDFPIAELCSELWSFAGEIIVDRYWSGEKAPIGRHFGARLLWSDSALYIRFQANQAEPLIVSDKPNVNQKTMNLWDRDVCEVFIAPDVENPNRYFEFEIAPNGEWIDIGVSATPNGRECDWEYRSKMQSAAKIGADEILMAIRIEWDAFGKRPKPGDVWLGNLFRCVGKDPNRGYLAWQPTETETPNFHVPEKFGELLFLGRDLE